MSAPHRQPGTGIVPGWSSSGGAAACAVACCALLAEVKVVDRSRRAPEWHRVCRACADDIEAGRRPYHPGIRGYDGPPPEVPPVRRGRQAPPTPPTPPKPRRAPVKLNERQQRILAAVWGQHDGVPTATLRAGAGLGPRAHVAFRRLVLPLMEAGLLRRTGRSRGTRYHPTERTPHVPEPEPEPKPGPGPAPRAVRGEIEAGSAEGWVRIEVNMGEDAPAWLRTIGTVVELREVE